MKRCSYTWEQWNKEKGSIEKQCPEKTWPGSEEYCIFHDPSPDKDAKLFEEKLKQKLGKKNYSFIGYHFPENIDFTGTRFEGDATFKEATFQGDASFEKTIFQNVEFGKAIFENSIFNGAAFQNASFIGVSFQRNSDFSKTIFQNAYFGGATFLSYADFSEAKFQNEGNFGGAKFHLADFSDATLRKASFRGAIFQKDAFFNRTKFQRVHFNQTKFYKGANFKEAIFQEYSTFSESTFKNANFNGATFKKASFDEAVIERNLSFVPKKIQELDLRNVQFFFRGHITADLAKARFHRAELENVAFIDCEWPNQIYEEVHMEDESLSFKELETIYRNLKQNMQRHGDYSKAGDFYYREMECRKQAMGERRFSLDWFKSFWYSILKYSCGYGEKPFWVIRNSLFVILLGAVLFFFCGVARVSAEVPPEEYPDIIDYSLNSLNFSSATFQDFGYCLYYSIVTFTTLGYGDIHPLGYSHILASAEALTGAFFMALFVVVFARKMMR